MVETGFELPLNPSTNRLFACLKSRRAGRDLRCFDYDVAALRTMPKRMVDQHERKH